MKYSEVDILNFLEGKIDDRATAEFLAEQRNDRELKEAVETMQASMVPIHQAYARRALPPVPDSIRHYLDEHKSSSAPLRSQDSKDTAHLESASAPIPPTRLNASDASDASDAADANDSNTVTKFVVPSRPITRMGTWYKTGLAACLLLGTGLGALSMQQYQNQTSGVAPSVQAQALSTMDKHQRLVTRVADYQSLYIAETVANVSAERHSKASALIALASGTEGSEVPDLSSFGYEFARAQHLGFEDETLVQLVYRKEGVAPLALCFMPDSDGQVLPMALSKHHHLNSASWMVNQHHFVLVAEETDAVMQQLYQAANDFI